MDPSPDHHSLIHRRRMTVRSFLSPPTVSIPLLFPTPSVEPHSRPLNQSHSGDEHKKTCRLCGSDNAGLDPEPEATQMVRGMMSQVGLALSEEDCTFCPFCSSQLQGLVRLKKEMDRLGDRLCSMIIGLQSLLSTTTTTAPLKKEEDNGSPENEAIQVLLDEDNAANINTATNTEQTDSLQPSKPTHNFVDTRVKSYPCHNCDKTFNRLCSLTRHVANKHSPQQDEEEESCMRGNSSQRIPCNSVRQVHKEKFKRPFGLFSCSFCPLQFSTKVGLQMHYRTHLPAIDRPHNCSNCPSRFKTKHHLETHMSSHFSLEDRPYVCPQCPRRFGLKQHLKSHIYTHLPIHLRPFPCPHCPSRFYRKDVFTRHVLLQHKDQPHMSVPGTGTPFRDETAIHSTVHLEEDSVCPEASRTDQIQMESQTESKVFNRHNISKEGEEKTFSCLRCSKHFQDSDSLTVHSFTHAFIGVKPRRIPCPHCDKMFMTAQGLKRHSVVHVGDGPHNSCYICEDNFSSHYFLKRHLLCEHGVTIDPQTVVKSNPAKCHSTRRHVCSVCSTTFNHPSKLAQHATTHTGERPYPCRICSERFAQKSTLLRHSYTHLPKEEWPFPCPHCHRRFIKMASLESHVKTHFPPDEKTYPSSHQWRPKTPPEEFCKTHGNEARDGEEESKAEGIFLGEVDIGDNLDHTGSIINGICDGLEEPMPTT